MSLYERFTKIFEKKGVNINNDSVRIPALDASKITSGTFDTARIPALDASKITSGAFDTARIPALDASKITSGAFGADRIPALDASKITSGTFSADRIPSLFPELPAEDGDYVLTVTISSGEPTFIWEDTDSK